MDDSEPLTGKAFMTDDWKETVGRQLGQLHQDVRHLLYAFLVGVFLLFAAGFGIYSGLSLQLAETRVQLAEAQGKIDAASAKLDLQAGQESSSNR